VVSGAEMQTNPTPTPKQKWTCQTCGKTWLLDAGIDLTNARRECRSCRALPKPQSTQVAPPSDADQRLESLGAQRADVSPPRPASPKPIDPLELEWNREFERLRYENDGQSVFLKRYLLFGIACPLFACILLAVLMTAAGITLLEGPRVVGQGQNRIVTTICEAIFFCLGAPPTYLLLALPYVLRAYFGTREKLEAFQRNKSTWFANRRDAIEAQRREADRAESERKRQAEAEERRRIDEEKRVRMAAAARVELARKNWREHHAPLGKEKLDSMTGEEFERWLVCLLELTGYRSVRLTPRSGDHGADIVATLPYIDETVCIQAKRWRKPVGNKVVQEVLGGMRAYEAQHGIVAAVGGFTKLAKELAAKPPPIELWDGVKLLQMAASVQAFDVPPFDEVAYRERVLRPFYERERERAVRKHGREQARFRTMLEEAENSGVMLDVSLPATVIPPEVMPDDFQGPPEGIREYEMNLQFTRLERTKRRKQKPKGSGRKWRRRWPR
jgi:hypothetical protein